MFPEKFDLIKFAPGISEACRFIMPISGGAPDADKPGEGSAEEIEDILNGDDKPDAEDKPADKEVKDEETPDIAPEDDYDIKLKDGKVMKYSEVVKLQKQGQSFTKKSQELSQGMAELSALKDMQLYLQDNPEKLKKVLEIIQDVKEAAADAKKDGDDPADAMAEVFKTLDMKNPTNVLIKALFDGQSKMLKKMAEVEKGDQAHAKSEQQRNFKEATEKATNTLNSTFDQTFKELKVTDKEEIAIIRQMALSFLKDNPKQYKGDEDFKAEIASTIKKFHLALNKFGESRLSAYLKSKGGNGSRPANRAASDRPKSDKEKTDNGEEDNLQETILEALTAQENGQLDD